MSKNQYYTLDKILTKKDINGNEPNVFFITNTRSSGKTTAILQHMLDDFRENKHMFVLLYRTQGELDSATEVFGELNNRLSYGTFTKKIAVKGYINEILLNDEKIGFAVSMKNPDKIKKFSPIFSCVENIFLDEYQLETKQYLKDEMRNFRIIVTSIARGKGERIRNSVKIFLAGNPVDLFNPYYIAYGIYNRILPNTKYLRGRGFVGDFRLDECASKDYLDSPLINALGMNESDPYYKYLTQVYYLNGSTKMISKPACNTRYLFTISAETQRYGIRYAKDSGDIYCTKTYDPSCPYVFVLRTDDVDTNTFMLRTNAIEMHYLRTAFTTGKLFFENGEIKTIILDLLALDRSLR